ncbi:MAG: glycosyltransferase family 39 protein [Actinobacteria bacterium]|nr:glycosyltransferase family 39 protein [Actinomycetota bacterium]
MERPIWFVYLLGKELFSRRIGLRAAAFTAFSPFLIWCSRDATDYSLLISLATLSTYFLVRSVRRGGWGNWAAYVKRRFFPLRLVYVQ